MEKASGKYNMYAEDTQEIAEGNGFCRVW